MRVQLFVAFIGLAISASVQGQRCQTLPTPGGTPFPRQCVFPFTFNRRRYNSCTRVKDPDNKPWCSVSVDANGNHVGGTGAWGHCGQGCFQAHQVTAKPTSVTQRPNVTSPSKPPLIHTEATAKPTIATTTPTLSPSPKPQLSETPGPSSKLECVTESGPASGRTCVLPFMFAGVKHEKCVPEKNDPSLTWCSTKVDVTGTHMKGNWGYCSCRTVLEPTLDRVLGSGLTTQPSTQVVTESAVQESYQAGVEDQSEYPDYGVAEPDLQLTCREASFNELKFATTDGSFLPEMNDVDFRCGVSRLSGIKATFIIGGKESKLQEFPFAVLIGGRRGAGKILFVCGGSLINRRYVLTAAHCFGSSLRVTKVRLGEYDLRKDCDCLDGKCAPLAQTIDVEEIRVHENYDRFTNANDIALIRMVAPAKLNPGVGVVCLPALAGSNVFNADMYGQDATVIGWGRTKFDSKGTFDHIGASTPIIRKVEVPIVSRAACRNRYRAAGINSQHICAGDENADSCKGDSGGPLLYRSSAAEPWILIGVVSFGDTKCGWGDPGVYANVQHFVGWIKRNLRP